MMHEATTPENVPEVLAMVPVQEDITPEASMCGDCIHRTYCACRGKTGYCGNYIHRATRVFGGTLDPFRLNA